MVGRERRSVESKLIRIRVDSLRGEEAQNSIRLVHLPGIDGEPGVIHGYIRKRAPCIETKVLMIIRSIGCAIKVGVIRHQTGLGVSRLLEKFAADLRGVSPEFFIAPCPARP